MERVVDVVRVGEDLPADRHVQRRVRFDDPLECPSIPIMVNTSKQIFIAQRRERSLLQEALDRQRRGVLHSTSLHVVPRSPAFLLLVVIGRRNVYSFFLASICLSLRGPVDAGSTGSASPPSIPSHISFDFGLIGCMPSAP